MHRCQVLGDLTQCFSGRTFTPQQIADNTQRNQDHGCLRRRELSQPGQYTDSTQTEQTTDQQLPHAGGSTAVTYALAQRDQSAVFPTPTHQQQEYRCRQTIGQHTRPGKLRHFPGDHGNGHAGWCYQRHQCKAAQGRHHDGAHASPALDIIQWILLQMLFQRPAEQRHHAEIEYRADAARRQHIARIQPDGRAGQ